MQSNVSTVEGSAGPTPDHADSPPEDDETDDSASALSRDVVFDVLSSTRRRYVLHHLRRTGGTTNLKELSTTVASWEYDTPPEEVSSKQRTRVYTALRQSHLPKMDREDIVDFDPNSGDVTITSEATDLEVYLDIVPHDEIPWSTYYLGVGLIGTVVALATWLDVFPLAYVPDGLAALLLALIVTVSAAVHVRNHRNNRLGSDERSPI
jgi:hypothetical protein